MSRKWSNAGVVLGAVVVAAVMLLFRVNDPSDPGKPPWEGPTVQRDLHDLTGDTLRALMLRDPLVWEQRQKTTTGLEYELLQRFAKRMQLKLVVEPFDDPDSLLAALWQGRGDVGAAQLVSQKDWKGRFSGSEPFVSVRPLIAQLRTKDDPAAIPSAPVPVARASPFASPEYVFGPAFKAAPSREAMVTEEEHLLRVVLGQSQAALIGDLRAGHEAARFPILEFSGTVGPPQGLRFVVRANSPDLLAALNAWITDQQEIEARRQIIRAYSDGIPASGPLRSRKAKGMRSDSISPFDAHFRKHATVGRWNWELLAAMAWKETRFDSTVTSRKGAMGIMQFMPNTAEHLGLDSTSTMEEHIQAAVRYLDKLDLIWLRAVPDREERLRFVLASYNAGPGHIIDAQRLAEQLGLDPVRWEGHVERAVLLLAKPQFFLRPEMKNGYCKGSQVYYYVHGVLGVYKQLLARKGRKPS